MRKRAFILVLSFGVLKTLAQTNVYHAFPDSNAVWRNTWTDICSTQSWTSCQSEYQYSIKGDTAIAGKKYIKVHREGFWKNCMNSQGGFYCSSPAFSSYLSHLLYEDTIGRKIYFYTTSQDILLYDFSLNTGDTLNAVIGNGFVISSIDSVLIQGNYRKKFIASATNTFNLLTIIEGIGLVDVDTSGTGFWADLFLAGPCICPSTWKFNCFWQDGIHIYGDTACSALNSMHENPATSGIVSIGPNPSPGNITIVTDNDGLACPLVVVNTMGQVLYADIARSNVTHLELSFLPNGVYFLNLGSSSRRKLVIQH